MSLSHAGASAAAARAARDSYGRLVAWLAWQWRDIAAAEDALAEAFATALARWPIDGVPDSPEAWLLAAARRHLLMAARRRRLAEDPALTVLFADAETAAEERPAIPDDRLRLMLVCAHPAIDAGVRSALMLQTVLGVEAARIAGAFLVSPEAMMKRLTRAKAKIRETGIRFEPPVAGDLEERVQAVLEAIYAAYVLHWGHAPDDSAGDLADEAVYLAELVVAHLPAHAEANGLLALLWLCESRKGARLGPDGEFVPLDRQDTAHWDAALIRRADERLAVALAQRAPGAFQYEAAIQAAHCERAVTGTTPWRDIVRLYERLLEHAPTIGARIGHAVALAHAEGDAGAGLRLLKGIDAGAVAAHQPWWAALAHLRERNGEMAAAASAYDRALALTREPALRRFLERRRSAAG